MPKGVPRLDSVGPQVFFAPRSVRAIRAIVPLPLLVGPMSHSILWRLVSPLTR